ncbi:MAG: envelope stress response membrane protein PspC [Gammaproteobacteria bacterium]|nr:MAG: envelope stress response membrane protein PspC [Gammaproteobacteria bacterium]
MSCNPCGSGPNSKELYRLPSRGKIAGVCAGLADYLGWETWLVRILVVSGVLFGMPFLIMIYIAGWFILDKKPNGNSKNKFNHQEQRNSSYTEDSASIQRKVVNESIKVKSRIWQAGEPPKQAFHDIRRKFNGLEKQLRQMESYVTSAQYTVSREISKL